jgi:hypothetical protein
MKPDRAWALLPSRRRLNLLAPDPQAWTDKDLAIGLSRTYRWSGYSAWDLPLSVAQHSLTVLAIHKVVFGAALTAPEARRELVHDAVEALLGGWDPITPLKPHLGDGFRQLVLRHQAAVDARYELPPWDEASYRRHKHCDSLAAASEAFYVAGWSRTEMREDLEIALDPLEADPLAPVPAFRAWEPWPPNYAAQRFLATLQQLHCHQLEEA